MNVATIPPGGVAYAPIHVGFELMLSLLEGRVRHESGPGLSQAVEHQAGDFNFLEPDVPQEVVSLRSTGPVVAVVTRSCADAWQFIIPFNRNRGW